MIYCMIYKSKLLIVFTNYPQGEYLITRVKIHTEGSHIQTHCYIIIVRSTQPLALSFSKGYFELILLIRGLS